MPTVARGDEGGKFLGDDDPVPVTPALTVRARSSEGASHAKEIHHRLPER